MRVVVLIAVVLAIAVLIGWAVPALIVVFFITLISLGVIIHETTRRRIR
jgi:fatty acid desaturase